MSLMSFLVGSFRWRQCHAVDEGKCQYDESPTSPVVHSVSSWGVEALVLGNELWGAETSAEGGEVGQLLILL